jgi:SAM-dependent methyltransferase
MLDVAKPKMADLPGIAWQTADFAKLPFEDRSFAAVLCSLGVMFVPDRKAAFAEARRVLAPGGLFLFNVWDRIEENPCVRTYAEVIEGMFPGDKEIQFRLPYAMHEEGMLRGLLDGAGFTVRRLETVRLPIEGVTAREIATGQIRGTPRGVLLAQRGVDFDMAIAKVTAALEKVGGAGAAFRSHCQVIVVEALSG